IQNPSPSAAMVRLDYFVSGQAIQTGLRDLPPNSRVTVTAFDSGSAGSLAGVLGLAGPSDIDFGLRVTSVAPGGGPDPSRAIAVDDTLPVGFAVTSASAGCGAQSGGAIRCTIGSLPAGASAVMTVSGSYSNAGANCVNINSVVVSASGGFSGGRATSSTTVGP